MTTPVSGSSSTSGRSPDANQIYQQYLTYYGTINNLINTVNAINPPTTASTNARTQLVNLQSQLYPIYQSDYNNSSATLATFETECASIMSQANAVVTNLTASQPAQPTQPTQPSPITVYSSNQRSPDAAAIYNQYLAYYATINTLITGLPATATSARSQLVTLQQQLFPIYQKDYNSSTATLASYKSDSASIMAQANQVANTPTTPTQPTQPTQPVQPVQAAPAPTAMQIQNGTWYLDWTSYNYPIPKGVNAVDIFVGTMAPDAKGNPSVGGFGTLSQNPTTFANFIAGCKAAGITVNISIGGSGGSYDNTWDVLTSSNVQSYAQALANFCISNGISGVDFDCEEFTSATDKPAQQALVGTLIKDFKQINPNFQTSLDTNAGFGPNFPWQGIVQNIMNAAIYTNPTTGKPTSGVDRVNIMAYFNSLSDEQGWVTGWATWLKQAYGLSPAQIGVGMDPSSGAYSTTQFATWAAKQGYSTFLWNYDPNQQAASDATTTSVLTAYKSG